MAGMFQFAKALDTEVESASFIPYSSHVTENTIKLSSGDFLQIIKLQGAAHESADIEDINNWHQQLNGMMRNMASPNVALWSHVVRREYYEYPGGEFSPGFCRDLNEKYREHVTQGRMLVNELYLSIVYRPQPVKVTKWLDAFHIKTEQELIDEQIDCLEKINDISGAAIAALFRYEPEMLGCYEYNGIMFSEMAEFLGYLVNGEWQRVPLPRSEIRDILTSSRPFFGKGGLMSLKAPTSERYASIIAIQEYPAMTHPGMLDDLLAMPYEMVISQSFTFLSKSVAVGRMQRQHGRMVNAGDLAKSQVNAIHDALDDLISNRFVMGAHNISLMIYAENKKQLTENVNLAGATLSNIGIKWTREEMGIASWNSQVRGASALEMPPVLGQDNAQYSAHAAKPNITTAKQDDRSHTTIEPQEKPTKAQPTQVAAQHADPLDFLKLSHKEQVVVVDRMTANYVKEHPEVGREVAREAVVHALLNPQRENAVAMSHG